MKFGMYVLKICKKKIKKKLDNLVVIRFIFICNKYNIKIFILIICELKILMMIFYLKSYVVIILVLLVMFIC